MTKIWVTRVDGNWAPDLMLNWWCKKPKQLAGGRWEGAGEMTLSGAAVRVMRAAGMGRLPKIGECMEIELAVKSRIVKR